jgi:SAM-dependent methyltransferase
MLQKIVRLINEIRMNETNIPQLASRVKMRLFNTQKDLKDDFDWTEYHNHYKQELNLLEKRYTLIPKKGEFAFENYEVKKVIASVKPLHSNHKLLYDIILKLNPLSVLEVGCGGGDHLNALEFFNPLIILNGIDRSERQLDFLRSRHPQLKATLKTCDISSVPYATEAFDLVYTQAVLMHISEKDKRFQTALKHVFLASRKYVVMMENWLQHDFEASVYDIINEKGSPWAGATVEFKQQDDDSNVRVMVVTRKA